VPIGQIVMATILAAAVVAVVWFVAVPAGPVVCPAIMPPPTNCMFSYREGTAVVLTIVTLAVYVATLVIALTVGRRRPVIVTAGIVVLVVVLLGAWPLIGLLPGFSLPGR
jgi:hypothetical protein